jgi:putative heme-binding domain-containing protein
VQIYQGGRYPKDTWGHAFIGNIHDNAIHEEVLTPVGSTFKCEPRRDFLRANDGWFRPVSTQTGPDGFLWVMDWCDKYPCYQNAKANPEGVDREKGRIWRIVSTVVPPSGGKQSPPKGGTTVLASRPTRDMNLQKLSTPELVKLLENSNSWMRRTARRMLVERKDETAAPLLLALLDTAGAPSLRLESLWTLHQCNTLRNAPLDQCLSDADAGVRGWVARLSGERFRVASQHLAAVSDKDIMQTSEKEKEAGGRMLVELDRIEKLASDKDISVRLSAAVALRMVSSGALTANRPLPDEGTSWHRLYHIAVIARDLIKASADSFDPLLQHEIWMSVERGLVDDSEVSLEGNLADVAECQPLSQTLVYYSMRRLCETRDAKNLDLAVAFCEKIQDHDVLLAHALDGLVKGQESGVLKPTVDVSKALAAWRDSKNAEVREHAQSLAVFWGDETATKELVALLSSQKADPKDRLEALQILRKVKSDTVRAGLVAWLSRAGSENQLPALESQATSSAVLVEAVRASADIGGNEFIAPLTKLAASKDFSIQQAALGALAGRADWAHAMLDAIAAGKVSSVGFPIPVRRSLATSKDKAIRDHAFKVLGAWKEASDDVKALIAAKKKACLEGEPDLAMGKMLFTTTCATCHTLYGPGQKVGPELLGSGRSNLDAILANVIDPNQIIGNGYEAINVTTKDNRVVSGRMVEDTPSHVKLLAIGGAEQIVPRDQIAKLENTHQSTMPMGFGALPDDVFRNLIWYVLAPPEEGPLTKEKKAALSASIDAAPAKKATAGSNSRAIDWESVSLWNPDWKVNAPDFERTPVKLADFHGRGNVLLMHPFAKDKPCSLERTVKLEAGKPHKLSITVAAHDQGDWELRVKVNGQEVKRSMVGHDGERWKTITVDLSEYAGKEVALRVEGAANGWSYEFGYWGEVKVE